MGNLDLLRACLSGLSEWTEEIRAEPEHGSICEVLFCDRWLSIPGGIPLDYRQLVGWHTAISRIEGMSHAADKVNMEQALARCRDAGLPGYSDEMGSYFPLAWILPEQLSEFKRHVQKKRFEARRSSTFIIKPSDGSEGENIRLVRDESKIPKYVTKTLKPAVAQEYIPPLLFGDKKFDLRLYALVTSVAPLEVWLHEEGLARFCAEAYEPPDDDNLSNSFSHLTNYSLNKKSQHFVHMSAAQYHQACEAAAAAKANLGHGLPLDVGDAPAGDGGSLTSRGVHNAHPEAEFAAGSFAGCSKRPISAVLAELEAAGAIDRAVLWRDILELTKLTMVALQPELAAQYRQRFQNSNGRSGGMGSKVLSSLRAAAAPDESVGAHSYRSWHLIGVDVLIDSRARPRLLEVNSNPSLSITHEIPDANAPGAPPQTDDNADAPKASMPPGAEISPVDLLVKRRVLTDALRIVGAHQAGAVTVDAAAEGGFQPVVLPTASAPHDCGDPPSVSALPRELTVLDRCRRLYAAFMRWASPNSGIDAAQFLRFAHRAGLVSLPNVSEATLSTSFQSVCGKDERKLPPESFYKVLKEVARLAYEGSANDVGISGRLERLLQHVATSAAME